MKFVGGFLFVFVDISEVLIDSLCIYACVFERAWGRGRERANCEQKKEKGGKRKSKGK